MPDGLSPNTVQPIKSESTGISANHTDLSTFGWAVNAAPPNAANTEAGPLDFPLHPGAERYYREKGYL